MTKRILVLAFCSALLFSLNSCKKDEEKATTIANITVKKNGKAKSGITVYLFKRTAPTFFKPIYASKDVVTDSEGIASFELQEVVDLEVIDNQTTLYFAVFNKETPIGQTALTIKKGETKSATINM